jgi:hypothetical protein
VCRPREATRSFEGSDGLPLLFLVPLVGPQCRLLPVSSVTSHSGSIHYRQYTFSPLQIVQTGSEVHPTSYPMGTGGSFPGGKAAGA